MANISSLRSRLRGRIYRTNIKYDNIIPKFSYDVKSIDSEKKYLQALTKLEKHVAKHHPTFRRDKRRLYQAIYRNNKGLGIMDSRYIPLSTRNIKTPKDVLWAERWFKKLKKSRYFTTQAGVRIRIQEVNLFKELRSKYNRATKVKRRTFIDELVSEFGVTTPKLLRSVKDIRLIESIERMGDLGSIRKKIQAVQSKIKGMDKRSYQYIQNIKKVINDLGGDRYVTKLINDFIEDIGVEGLSTLGTFTINTFYKQSSLETHLEQEIELGVRVLERGSIGKTAKGRRIVDKWKKVKAKIANRRGEYEEE